MKIRTTNKAIRENFSRVYRAGYCDLQDLLRYSEPVAYTCGVYGWNADVYDVDGVAIVTGYRPGVGRQIDYDVVKKYAAKARKIGDDTARTYASRKKSVNRLLEKFISEITAD